MFVKRTPNHSRRKGGSEISQSERLKAWAKAQKIVTNKMLRERFDVDEEMAAEYYQYLKVCGIVGPVGNVIKE